MSTFAMTSNANDWSKYDINVSTFRALSPGMQREYADHHNLPENCTTEEICSYIFPSGDLKYIERLPHHVLYPLPGPDGKGGRPFRSVMDCLDWMLANRIKRLLQPPELSDDTDNDSPPSQPEGTSSATVAENGSPLPSGSTHAPSSLDALLKTVLEYDSGDGALPDVDRIHAAVKGLTEKATHLNAQLQSVRDAKADLWDVYTMTKRLKMAKKSSKSSPLSIPMNEDLMKSVRRQARFAAKYNRLPELGTMGDDEMLMSHSSDPSASSDDSVSDEGSDSDDSDDGDNDSGNRGQFKSAAVPQEVEPPVAGIADGNLSCEISTTFEGESTTIIPVIPQRNRSSGSRAINPSSSVFERLRDLKWLAIRPSDILSSEIQSGAKRTREEEEDVSEQSRLALGESSQLRTPSPPKKRRLDRDTPIYSSSSSSGSSSSSEGPSKRKRKHTEEGRASDRSRSPPNGQDDPPAATPPPPKRRRLQDNSNEDISESNNLPAVVWKDCHDLNSDDSDSSFHDDSSSDGSSGPEDYILDSDGEVEMQLDCNSILNSPEGELPASDDYFADVNHDAFHEEDKEYDSDDSGITWISSSSEDEEAPEKPNVDKEPPPSPPSPPSPPRKPRPLARTFDFIMPDRQGYPTHYLDKRERWFHSMKKYFHDKNWYITDEELNEIIIDLMEDQYRFHDYEFHRLDDDYP